MFDSAKQEDRAKAVALYSAVNAIGWSLGALLGSWLVGVLPRQIEILGFSLHPTSNLPLVFFGLGCLRLLVSSSLLGNFHEARAVEHLSHRRLLWELPLIEPVMRLFVWSSPKPD